MITYKREIDFNNLFSLINILWKDSFISFYVINEEDAYILEFIEDLAGIFSKNKEFHLEYLEMMNSISNKKLLILIRKIKKVWDGFEVINKDEIFKKINLLIEDFYNKTQIFKNFFNTWIIEDIYLGYIKNYNDNKTIKKWFEEWNIFFLYIVNYILSEYENNFIIV